MSHASRFFQALGDATRLALLEELHEGEKTVGALVTALGCPQPKVSRHLKALKDVGLVRDRKEGRHVTYELATPALWSEDARRWIERLDLGLLPAELLSERSARHAAPGQVSPAPEPSRPRVEPAARVEDMETYLL